MARPIAFEVTPYDPREALRKRLEAAPLSTPKRCSRATSCCSSCTNPERCAC